MNSRKGYSQKEINAQTDNNVYPILTLYFDAIIIAHTFCSMLNILKELTINIAKGTAKFNDKYCVLDKQVNTQQQNKKAHIKNFGRAGNRTLDLSHRSLIRKL